MRRPEVVILGAGAAGLAAADALDRAGRAVLLLEGRDRIGGRICSRHEPGLAVPVELGAEFIHGEARATRALLERAGLAAVDAPRTHWMLRGGRLAPGGDVFADLQRALRGRAALRARDISVSELLERFARRGVARRTREFARLLVEGFDAADPALASARVVAGEWGGEHAADAPQFRPSGGYEVLLAPLTECMRSGSARLELQRVVQEVRWRRGHVEVAGQFGARRFRVRARRAVITLPLGVLQAPSGAPGAVAFTPPLSAKRRPLDQLLSGPALKVTLRFRTPFWERLEGGRFRDAAFLHAPDADFPTLWTTLPLRTAALNAWCGGPRAARFAGASRETLVERALASVAAVFGSRATATGGLQSAHVHDWSLDPLARGAYSYVRVGGGTARRRLAQPLADTLFFAGEATDDDAPATVEGALRSGLRAARQVLESLR